MEQEKWKKLDGSSVVFDGEGRMKMLATCKCGATAWVKQGKIFKSVFTGRCPSCDAFLIARVKHVRVGTDEVLEDDCRIKDVSILTAHLVDVAIRTVDPVLYDAALMLTELHEKHWDECLQIGKYSEAERILTNYVLAAGKDEGAMLIPVESGSNCVGCVNDVGDEDCAKCLIYGILLNGCHYKCEEYEDIFGNKPNRREGNDGKNL